MTRFLVAYAAVLVVFLVLDAGFLTLVGPRLYRPALNSLLAEKVRLVPAALFYCLYAAGLVILAVRPGLESATWIQTALFGAVLGLTAYGTYDLTNAAILKQWSWTVTVCDVAWGAVASGAASVVGFWAASKVAS